MKLDLSALPEPVRVALRCIGNISDHIEASVPYQILITLYPQHADIIRTHYQHNCCDWWENIETALPALDASTFDLYYPETTDYNP